MSTKNKVQLITYVDRFGGATLDELNTLLTKELNGLFGGVHLLPFYYPIDGADAGFDPIEHTSVDNRLGRWSDVAAMGEKLDIMADMIVNHMSAQSKPFQDVLENGPASQFWPLFLTRDSVFDEPNSPDISKVFRPRPASSLFGLMRPAMQLKKRAQSALCWKRLLSLFKHSANEPQIWV